MDVAGESQSNNANVQIHGFNNTPAQRWRIESYNGHYILVNVGSGKALDVTGAKSVNGTNIQQHNSNFTPAQLWDFIDAGNGSFFSRSVLDGRFALDVAGGSVSNNANVQLYNANGSLAQIWNSNKTLAQKWQVQLDDQGRATFKNAIQDVFFPMLAVSFRV